MQYTIDEILAECKEAPKEAIAALVDRLNCSVFIRLNGRIKERTILDVLNAYSRDDDPDKYYYTNGAVCFWELEGGERLYDDILHRDVYENARRVYRELTSTAAFDKLIDFALDDLGKHAQWDWERKNLMHRSR